MDSDPQNSQKAPHHVAIIMDGNGRWAEARGQERNAGHREGLERVRDVVRAAHDLGVEYLTLYAFSQQNWERPREEVAELMRLLEYYLEEELPEVMDNGIRIRMMGRKDRLPPSTRAAIEDAVARTADHTNMDLTFCLSYGGRTEIVDAARKLLRDFEEGKVDPDALDEKQFASYLYEPDVPDPDLLIRTGHEQRVSNFLLWQIAYTEIYTSPLMWPEFGRPEFEAAIRDFQTRERRFGKTSAQVAGADAPAPGATRSDA